MWDYFSDYDDFYDEHILRIEEDFLDFNIQETRVEVPTDSVGKVLRQDDTPVNLN